MVVQDMKLCFFLSRVEVGDLSDTQETQASPRCISQVLTTHGQRWQREFGDVILFSKIAEKSLRKTHRFSGVLRSDVSDTCPDQLRGRSCGTVTGARAL